MTVSERWDKLTEKCPELNELSPFTQLWIKWALIDANTDGYLEHIKDQQKHELERNAPQAQHDTASVS